MGRHPKDDLSVRSEGLRLRLTKAEHAWIKVMAKEQNCSMREILWQNFQKGLQGMSSDEIGELSAKVTLEMKKKGKQSK